MWNLLLGTDPKALAPLPLRLVLGTIFAAHGSQKLFGWFGGYGLTATAAFFEGKLGMSPGMLWALLAGLGEFLGAALVLSGLFTRFGALNIAAVMTVAIVRVHWGAFFMPLGMEYTLALLAAAISLVLSGGGALSADALLCRRCQ